ncbi:MAG: hypothetical protein M0010_15195 [Actinomycetota bacterium]|jgi:hypothetical protein|nr:hypothetical protein [Actinomycetota bacterium]
MSVTSLQPRRRRTYVGEEIWFPVLEDVGPTRLRRAFIRCGVSPAIAGNLVWFLEDQRSLDRHLAADTGVKYRRILAELDPDEVLRAARTTPGQFKQAA